MHHFRYANITLLLIVFILCKICNGGCPNPHRLHPCICLRSRSVLTCEDLFSEEKFKTITEVSRGHGIVGIEFEAVAMRFIPENAFEGLEIKFLTIKNSSIHALSDTDRAFIGVEKTLETLVIENSFFLSQWEWTHLMNLTKLQELAVLESLVLELGPEFLNLSKLPLTVIKFVDTHIRWLPPRAFSSFKDLKQVSLDKNDLIQVNRTLFPRPAKKLESLGLGHNQLKYLPNDIFVDMPALKHVYLGANKLYILHEDIFKPIWKQLSTFVFHNAHLICDCRLKWVTKMKNKGKFVVATCTTPSRLKGRRITTLEADELWCHQHSVDDEMQLPADI